MLTSASELIGFRVMTQDGKAGRVRDMYIKDNIWAVRFFVTGKRRFPPSFGVLLSTLTVEWIDLHNQRVLTALSRSDLHNCSKASSRITVSERRENAFIKSNIIHGPHISPMGYEGLNGIMAVGAPKPRHRPDDHPRPNELRSMKKLLGYRVHRDDDYLGTLDDFLLEDNFWVLRYLVVKRPDGRRILIAAERVDIISWFDQGLWVNMTEQDAARAPEYNAEWLSKANKEERPMAVSI